MNLSKIKLFLPTILLLTGITLHAQNYKTAVGVSLGTGIGLTAQQYLFDNFTLQANLQKRLGVEQTNLQLFFEQHQKIISRRFNVLVGGGPNLQWGKINGENGSQQNNRFGLSGVLGIEFNPGKFNLSWEFSPTLFVSGQGNVFQTQTGVSVRYVLSKREKKKFKLFKKKK